MSALIAWGAPQSVPPATRLPRRRQLRRVTALAPASALTSQPQPGQFAPVVRTNERAKTLRLTARGRLLRTVVVFGALALLALTWHLPFTQNDTLAVDRHAVVRPGQTLTHVAREQMPTLPLREAVVRLQLFNHLTAPEVSVGQSLAIPVAR